MESLWLTFEATMSSDRPTRQAAEERLANPAGFGFGCAGEYAVSLLRFAVAASLEAPPAGALGIAQNDVDVRVAAAVRLKNSHTQALWRDEAAFPPAARTAFRDDLIGALFRADLNQRVRRLLLAVLQQVHQYDWKSGSWPELLPMVSGALESGVGELLPVLDHVAAQAQTEAAATPSWATGALSGDNDAAASAGVARRVAVAARLLTLCAKAYDDAIHVTHQQLDDGAAEIVPMVLTLLDRLSQDSLVAGMRVLRREAGLLDPTHPNAGGVLPNFCAVAAALDEASYLCLKALWYLTSSRIPRIFLDEATFAAMQRCTGVQWAAGNAGLADWRRGVVVTTGCPLDDEDVQSSAERPLSMYFWKCMKRAAAMSHRWIQNSIQPKAVEARMKPTAAAFMANNTAALLEVALTTLWVHHNKSGRVNPITTDAADAFSTVGDNLPAPSPASSSEAVPEPPVHSKACIMAMEFVDVATGSKPLYARIHPIAGPLLTDIVFERLQMTSSEREQWNANPLEFVRRLSDPRNDHYSPKTVASALLVRLCIPAKKFQDKTLIAGFAQHIQQVLVDAPAAIAAASGPVDEGTVPWYAALSLDATLHAMAQLRSAIGAGWPLRTVMTEHIVPLLASSIGFLRAHALHVLAVFLNAVDWSAEDYNELLSRVIPLLDDTEVPVRMRMAMSVAAFVRHRHAYDIVAPNVGHVVTKLLEVMKMMDSESVVYALRQIIKHYSATVAGWAVRLTAELVSHFNQLHQSIGAKAAAMADGDSGGAAAAVYRGLGGFGADGLPANARGGQPDEDDMEAACAAADELLATIGTLTKSIPSTYVNDQGVEERCSGIFLDLQRILAPLIATLLDGSSDMGFMDSTLRLLTRLVKRSDTVETSTWACFRALHKIIVEQGSTDYFAQLVPPIDNFLSVDPATFVNASVSGDASPAGMLAEMIERVLFDFENARRRERIEAFKVIDIMLLAARNAAATAQTSPDAVAAFARRYSGPLSGFAGTYFGALQQRKLCELSPSEWAIISASYLSCLIVLCDYAPDAVNATFPAQHLSWVLSRFGDLLTETNLRVYDRKMFISAAVSFSRAVASNNAALADGVNLEGVWQTVIALLFQTSALEAAAVESCVYKAARYEAKQAKKAKGQTGRPNAEELDDADDSDLDDFTDSDGDDDSSDGYSHDGDDDDDDDDDGEEGGGFGAGDLLEEGLDDENAAGGDEDDKAIRNMDQFAHTVAAARRLAEREAGLVDDAEADDYDDTQIDHLEDCDFTSPLDAVDEFALVSEACAALVDTLPAVAGVANMFSQFQNVLPNDVRAPEMKLKRGRGFIPEREQPTAPPLVYSANPEAGDRFGGEPAPSNISIGLSDFLAAASRQRAFLREHKVRVKR